ncbi:MAG: AzlC family ABC transporter permease [Sporichthyaceae bacterium]
MSGERGPRESFRLGLRLGLPYAIANSVVALSFGVLATELGFSAFGAILTAAIVFAGGAQFAALAVLGAGGTVPAAVGSAALVNSRFLPLGIALAPSLPGRPLWRAAQGWTVVDSSWIHAKRSDGSFDRWTLFGSSGIQYAFWVLGTAVGALGGDVLPDTDELGLDAVFPAFFLALLFGELRAGRRRAMGVAAAAALLALALVPNSPAGVPVLAAGAVALVGIRMRPAPVPEPSEETP